MLAVLLATTTGCNKSDWGTEPQEDEVEGMKLLIEDKYGNPIEINQADEPIVIAGSITNPKYSSYQLLSNGGYRVRTGSWIFVSLKYEGLQGELLRTIYVNFGGGNTRLTNEQIDRNGSYFRFRINRDREVLRQDVTGPTHEVTFFWDQQEQSDRWQGSVNNWDESEHGAWFGCVPGKYFVVSRDVDEQYQEPLNPEDLLIYALVRRYNTENIIGTYQVRWYSLDDNEIIQPSYTFNADGSISQPTGLMNQEEITIYFGGE